MNITQILKPACVRVPLKSKDKFAEINELIDVLDSNHLLLDKNAALQAVLEREKARSTGIGSGIAIPHGKCTAVKELVMAVGIASEPINFESADGKPVKIILLLVSPTNQTGPHLQALAKISRLMLDEDFKKELEKSSSSDTAFKLLSKKETLMSF
jgi:fructose-specific phosphotransferase system IIA component